MGAHHWISSQHLMFAKKAPVVKQRIEEREVPGKAMLERDKQGLPRLVERCSSKSVAATDKT
jgi:hypothetical protein